MKLTFSESSLSTINFIISVTSFSIIYEWRNIDFCMLWVVSLVIMIDYLDAENIFSWNLRTGRPLMLFQLYCHIEEGLYISFYFVPCATNIKLWTFGIHNFLPEYLWINRKVTNAWISGVQCSNIYFFLHFSPYTDVTILFNIYPHNWIGAIPSFILMFYFYAMQFFSGINSHITQRVCLLQCMKYLIVENRWIDFEIVFIELTYFQLV